jgi:hypothetical protein
MISLTQFSKDKIIYVHKLREQCSSAPFCFQIRVPCKKYDSMPIINTSKIATSTPMACPRNDNMQTL